MFFLGGMQPHCGDPRSIVGNYTLDIWCGATDILGWGNMVVVNGGIILFIIIIFASLIEPYSTYMHKCPVGGQ